MKTVAEGRRLMQPRRVITDVGGFPDFSCESVALVIILDDVCLGESWAGWENMSGSGQTLMLVTSHVNSMKSSRTQGISAPFKSVREKIYLYEVKWNKESIPPSIV